MTNRDRFLAYLLAYAAKDIEVVSSMLADDVTLRDWKIFVQGKAAAIAETTANFEAATSIQIQPIHLYEAGASVSGELRIVVNDCDELFVVDVLDFNAEGQITAIRAFLGRGDR
jgi:steroid delta-isomerase